ncbi:MAG: hypothetical protein HY648_13915, partial [Acidobacteria bacterium]|nr:hypothetical protein [Acidobacteriota bacterium]
MDHNNDTSSGAGWGRLYQWTLPIVYLSQNLISLAGVVLTTGTFFAIAVLVLTSIYGYQTNPYVN